MTNHSYQLTQDAKNDLVNIAKYTEKTWGKEQAFKYAKSLDACFEKISRNTNLSKTILPKNKDVHVCKCEHHYIFYLKRKAPHQPVILAVFHERMDLMERLRDLLPL